MKGENKLDTRTIKSEAAANPAQSSQDIKVRLLNC